MRGPVYVPLTFSHYLSRPVPVPELFGKYPTRPAPYSKTSTRRALIIVGGLCTVEYNRWSFSLEYFWQSLNP